LVPRPSSLVPRPSSLVPRKSSHEKSRNPSIQDSGFHFPLYLPLPFWGGGQGGGVSPGVTSSSPI
ncbi:MAG: hypothetical protein WCP32_18610, partial [Bacteroidota bacterium]